jgi:hypothetical protein
LNPQHIADPVRVLDGWLYHTVVSNQGGGKQMSGFRFLKCAAVCLATLGIVLPQAPAMADNSTGGSVANARKGRSIPDVSLTTGGTFSGRVVDHTGKVLEGAKVTLGQDKKEIASTVTDKDGIYSFRNLKGGIYEVSSGNTDGIFRVWTEKSAPPSAKGHALLVMGENGARGQFGCCDPTLVILTAGVIAAVVLSAITLDKVNKLPTSP